MSWVFCLVVLLLVLAFLIRWQAGLGFGWISYRDSGRNSQVFVSNGHRLKGKPDFVERGKEGIVPVEYKSHKGTVRVPFQNHVAQVLAYCFLLEDIFGAGRIRKGRVVYDGQSFDVAYGAKERASVAHLITKMRMLRRGAGKRNHNEAGKCRTCSFREDCNQRLI